MKFISCHIENFGRLSDFSCEFSEGTNIICEQNGWGKSTFAAFIRAMFYGLEGERKRNPAENERKKYRPWQGGVFGGQLVFEIQGKRYQIARIFHDRDTNDEFELRDAQTNLPSKDYSKKIGEEIFQIDRESFLRTVFIGQNECQTASTDDINARLGNWTDGANGLNNFDAAYASLTEIVNELTPARASGLLAKRKEEIAQLERLCREGEEIPEGMRLCQERMRAQEENYNTLKENLKEAGRWQERITQMQSACVEKSEWLRLKKAFAEKKEEEAAVAARFPKEVPALSEVKEQIAQCAELGRAYERASLCQLSEQEENRLSVLEKVFWDNMPGSAQLDAKIREASELARLSQERGNKGLSRQEKQRLDEIAPHFFGEAKNAGAGGAGSAAEMMAANAAMVAAWEERNRKKAALPSDQDVLAELLAAPAQKKPSAKISTFLFLGGILLAAAGIVAAGMYSMVPGIIMALAGFAATAAGIQKKVAMQMLDEAQPGENSGDLSEDTAFIRQADAKVDAYLKAHGREFGDYDEQEIGFVLQEIRMEAAEYLALLKKAQGMPQETEDLELEQRSQSIAAFLGRFGISAPPARYQQELCSLKEHAAAYAALAEKQDKFEDARTKYERVRAGIAAFYEKYGIAPERNISLQLNQILDAVYDYEKAAEAFERAASALEQFEAKNDVSLFEEENESGKYSQNREVERTKETFPAWESSPFEEDADSEENESAQEMPPEQELPSLEDIHEAILALNEEMERVRGERAQEQKVFDDLKERYENWEENRVRLEQLKEIQAVQQKKYELVFQARAKLAAAKETMTAKYAAPILDGFSRYYELLAGKSAERFHVDANAQVTVDEYGKQRGINTFSMGLRDLAGICLRLAFVDAMYPQETPVLVMDDPFTNFDDEKLAAAGAFLAEVAKKYQIIYFTCSKSRA